MRRMAGTAAIPKGALAYSHDSRWRNRSEFVNGREAIIGFLTRKWQREPAYRLIKELWAFTDNRIALRFAYEWHDDSGTGFGLTGTKTGSLGQMASCESASPPSTTHQSEAGIAGFISSSAVGRTTTPASAIRTR